MLLTQKFLNCPPSIKNVWAVLSGWWLGSQNFQALYERLDSNQSQFSLLHKYKVLLLKSCGGLFQCILYYQSWFHKNYLGYLVHIFSRNKTFSLLGYSHLCNKCEVTLTNFEKFHPPKEKIHPPGLLNSYFFLPSTPRLFEL